MFESSLKGKNYNEENMLKGGNEFMELEKLSESLHNIHNESGSLDTSGVPLDESGIGIAFEGVKLVIYC